MAERLWASLAVVRPKTWGDQVIHLDTCYEAQKLGQGRCCFSTQKFGTFSTQKFGTKHPGDLACWADLCGRRLSMPTATGGLWGDAQGRVPVEQDVAF